MLALLALAACAPAPTPAPSHTAVATDAPVFASDEEALAAAKKAYAGYLAASDASGSLGSESREVFLALSIGEAQADDRSAETLFDERGWHRTGTTTFDSMSVQSAAPNEAGEWEVHTYLCLDVSESDVVDVTGASMSKADRPLRLPLEVAFLTGARIKSNLLVSESRVWPGSNFC